MSLDKWFKPKSAKTSKPNSQVLSQSQPNTTKTDVTTTKKQTQKETKADLKSDVKSDITTKKPKQPDTTSEEKRKGKSSKSVSIVVSQRKLDKDEKPKRGQVALTRTGKKVEAPSSNHYSAFSHDTTAKNKGSKLYVDKDMFDPDDECNSGAQHLPLRTTGKKANRRSKHGKY